MAKKREPIDLIKAKGKKHLTENEYETRKNEELEVPFIDVKPPAYLNAKEKKEFTAIATKLLQLDIMTELDADALAQYCIAKGLYLQYSDQIKKILTQKNAVHKWAVIDELATDCETQEDLKKLLEAILRRQRGDDVTVMMNLQHKAFQQCLACAKELGLTITSRCKIVVPPPPESDDDEL